MKIFVIIVTYKGKRWYDKCFGSLRESTIPVQVVVVDNTPGDEDAEYIKAQYPEVHLIKPEENLGFGKANNIAMRYALDHGGDYVFLLNQDAWLKPNTLSVMLPIAEQHPECGIYSPMHIGADEKSLCAQIEDGSTNHTNAFLSDCYFGSLNDIYRFRYINAAAWLIPRRTLLLVGGFDPIFFVYGEDDNYLQRLKFHGQFVGLIPKATIVHDHIDSSVSKASSYREEQFILVNFTNILKPLHIHKRICYLVLKTIQYLLTRRKSDYQYHRHELDILWTKRKEIILSRNKNIEKCATWLT